MPRCCGAFRYAFAHLDAAHFAEPSIRICAKFDIYRLVKKSPDYVKKKHAAISGAAVEIA
jgi:hypothetical protein